MKLKIKMHTMLNRFAFWVLFPMFIVAVFFIYRDAANAQLRVIGLAILGAFFLFVMYLFVFKLCVYDYAIFSEEGIELHTPFKQKVYYRYNEVIACLAQYTSIIEKKEYLTFTSKKYNSVVTHIDTSSSGNTIAINKMQVVYVPMSESIMGFLKGKSDLQWYANR